MGNRKIQSTQPESQTNTLLCLPPALTALISFCLIGRHINSTKFLVMLSRTNIEPSPQYSVTVKTKKVAAANPQENSNTKLNPALLLIRVDGSNGPTTLTPNLTITFKRLRGGGFSSNISRKEHAVLSIDNEGTLLLKNCSSNNNLLLHRQGQKKKKIPAMNQNKDPQQSFELSPSDQFQLLPDDDGRLAYTIQNMDATTNLYIGSYAGSNRTIVLKMGVPKVVKSFLSQPLSFTCKYTSVVV